MKSYSSLALLAALGVLSTVAAAQAVDTSAWKCESCPYPKGTSAAVEAGVGAVSGASAKYGDFTGLERKGGYLLLGGSLSQRDEGGFYADLAAADLGLDTRSLAAQLGQEGMYSLRLAHAELPRHFALDVPTPFAGIGSASLTLPAGFSYSGTATMPLASTPRTDIGFKAQRTELAGAWIGLDHWTLRISARHDVRDGTRPVTASFFSTATQLVAPVDHVTDQFEVAASYVRRGMHATLAWQLSQFRNGNSALTWDNPFWPVTPGSTRAQLALAPDNELQQLTGSAGWEISPMFRVSGDFAAGRLTQNAEFLRSTLTPGIVATLPAASLDGRVDTFNSNLRLTATPMSGLRVNASYAHNVRDNRTAVRSWPIVVTDIYLDPVPRSNTPFGLKQDRYKLDADYRAGNTVRLAAGAEQDDRTRSYTEVVDTRETTVWARASARPMDDLTLGFKLAQAERSHSAYGTATWFGSPENPLLRKYNLAERKRTSGSVRADYAFSEKISLGVTFDAADDQYGQSLIGLTGARSAAASADLALAFAEHTQLTLFVQGEQITSRQAGSQAWGAADWTARSKDRFEVFGLTLKHAAIPDKLDLGLDLSVSRASSDIAVDTIVNDPQFPAAKTSLDSVRVYATYKLGETVSLTGSIRHENYDTQDWRADGILPATLHNLLAFGQQAPRYRLNAVQLSLRYRF